MPIYPLFIGPPGSGKGTQAELLATVLLLPRISAGDLLREAASHNGAFAANIRTRLDAGSIIEDTFVLEMVDRRLNEFDCERGAILDGCVRTVHQAIAFDKLMARRGGITLIIFLSISDDLAASRMASRWTHRTTGAPFSPEQLQGGSVVANCGDNEFYRRPEDELPVIKQRQKLYWKLTAPAVEYYRHQRNFLELDGTQPVDVIHQHIVDTIRATKK